MNFFWTELSNLWCKLLKSFQNHSVDNKVFYFGLLMYVGLKVKVSPLRVIKTMIFRPKTQSVCQQGGQQREDRAVLMSNYTSSLICHNTHSFQEWKIFALSSQSSGFLLQFSDIFLGWKKLQNQCLVRFKLNESDAFCPFRSFA